MSLSYFHKTAWLFLLCSPLANASVVLLDNDWKLKFGGFAALDVFQDSTEDIGEIIGNGPVARPGSLGDHGRMQFSAKHSRFYFSLLAPPEDGWQSKVYFEGDFLGANTTGSRSTEQTFYSNGSFRVRHAYFSAEKEGWRLLAGQTSILFGFVPTYLLATVSVIPGPAEIYQRTAQLQALKTLTLTDQMALDIATALTRPTQSDSSFPNLDLGFKWKELSRLGRMTFVSGETRYEPTSVALSGTFRQFKTANSSTQQFSRTSAMALAVNLLFPLLSVSENSDEQSLVFTSSFTTGTGYADVLSGWTGNLSKFPQNATDPTRLDAGEGGYDSAGNFNLIRIQTWNAQLQYHLPARFRTWTTAGYGQLTTSDIGSLGPVVSGDVLYNSVGFYFINIAHDFTKQIRVAIEYSRKDVHYVDGVQAANHRFQFSALYRF